MKDIIFGLCVALTATTAACAGTGLPDEPVIKEYALAQKDFQLGSGLRVLVQEDHNSPLVVIASVYQAGGTSNPPGVEGLAHFVEHLAFRSHPGGGKQQLWDVLKRTGAEFNASTAADVTTYFAIAHKDRLSELMQLEAWRLLHTLEGVTEEVFEIERQVVRNELRQRRETSVGNGSFDELLLRLFPPSHPLGRPLAGTHGSLQAATLEHARQFVKTHYRPDNCTIVITGDVRADEVGALLGKWPAEALFGPGGPGAARVRRKLLVETPAPEPPRPASTALRRIKAPVSQSQLLMAWSAPGGMRGQDMLLAFVGAALNLALQTGIDRKENDDLLGATAGAVPLADGSVVLVQAELRRGADPEKARRRILDAVVDAWSSDLSRIMVRGGKWGAATNLLMASADPVVSALAASQFLATTGGTAFYARTLEELAAVQPTAVLAFAHKYLQRERAVSVFIEPEGDGSTREVALRPDSGGGSGRPDHELGRSDEVNILGMGPEEIRRVARPPGVAALPRFRLANGLQVVAVRRIASPTAEVHLQLPGGDATGTPYGLHSLAGEVSSSRCRDHGSLIPIGGSLGQQDDGVSSTYFARVLSGNLVNALAVLADEVSCREASDEDFLYLDERLERQAERQQERAKLPQVRSEKKFWQTLYPGHPYGLRESDAAQLRRIKFADVEAHVRGHFRPGNALAVVVSDVSPEELRPMMARYFERWSGGVGAAGQVREPPPGPARRTIHLFDRPQATQSTVHLGCRIERVRPETLPAFDLLAQVASEKAWELRESWGATYGIQAEVQDHPGGVAHLTFEGAVETGKTGAAVEKLLGLIGTLATQGPDIKTFILKRWDLARQYDRNFATPAAIARAVLRAERNGWPADVWDQYPARLADTGRPALRDIVAACAGHEVITVVGAAAAVRAQLEQQDLARFIAP